MNKFVLNEPLNIGCESLYRRHMIESTKQSALMSGLHAWLCSSAANGGAQGHHDCLRQWHAVVNLSVGCAARGRYLSGEECVYE